MYNPNFNFNDNSGMLTSRCTLTKEERLTFFRKFLNVIVSPTLTITKSLNNNTIDNQNLALVMQVFSSVHVDYDLFNLSIIDEDNANVKILKEVYNRNKFYMINAEPALDKVENNITILFTFYKDIATEYMQFLEDIKQSNGEALGYLYMKELIGLSMKNYKNKFTLANKAKSYFIEKNAYIDSSLRDQAAIALSKMAIEFHLNSMIIDNMDNNVLNNNIKLSNNINYLKNSPFILYDEKYNYKMTQLDILNLLLEDAEIEYMDTSCNNSDEFDNGISGESENNGKSSEENENSSNESDNKELENDEENSGNNGDSSNESNEIDYDDLRNSPYANNNKSNNNNNKDIDNDNKFLKITFKSNNKKVFFMKMPPQKPNPRYQSLDYSDEQSIDSVQKYIDVGMQKLRGTGINSIIERIGEPIKMEIPWDEKYYNFVNSNTYNANSTKQISTWYKQNILTRHITTLPGKIFLPQSFPTFYVLFDQSGSMSNNTIRKINGLIKKLYENKYDINILIHDYAQTADEVEVYELRPRSFSENNDNFMLSDILNSRTMHGGTSHKGVFDLMEVYIKDVTNGDKKYSIHYPLLCSDLESDIMEIYKNYEWIKLLNSNIRIVTPCDENNTIKLPFGETYYGVI